MRHSQTFSSCLSSWNNSRYLYLENSKLPLITSTGFVHPFLGIDARRRLVKSIINRAEVVLGAMNNSGLSIGKYLDSGQIEQVACGGENYGGSRPCDFAWVQELRNDCVARNITFCFMETGTVFVKDGKTYRIKSKQQQNLQAYKSGMTYQGKSLSFELKDTFGQLITKANLYVPHFVEKYLSVINNLSRHLLL